MQQLAAIFTEGMQHALVTVEKAEEEVGRREGVLEGVVLCVSKKLATQKGSSFTRECHRTRVILSPPSLLSLASFPLASFPLPAQLHNLAGSLGADCHWAFDESCTHYVYQVAVCVCVVLLECM